MHRRAFGAVLCAVALGAAWRARAKDISGLDGSWGGVKDGATAQVIITGVTVIGFYWRDDYVETKDATVSTDGQSVTLDFPGGQATLTRTGEAAVALEVREGGRITRFELKRD